MTEDTKETFSQDGYAPAKSFSWLEYSTIDRAYLENKIRRMERAFRTIEVEAALAWEAVDATTLRGTGARKRLNTIMAIAYDLQIPEKQDGPAVRDMQEDSPSTVDGGDAAEGTSHTKPSDFCLRGVPYEGVNSPATWGFK